MWCMSPAARPKRSGHPSLSYRSAPPRVTPRPVDPPVQLSTSFNKRSHQGPLCTIVLGNGTNAFPMCLLPRSRWRSAQMPTERRNKCDYCHSRHARATGTDCHNVQSWAARTSRTRSRWSARTPPSLRAVSHQRHQSEAGGCISCHGDQHNGLVNCVDCHVLAHFVPSTFKHAQEGPHIPAGDGRCPATCPQGGSVRRLPARATAATRDRRRMSRHRAARAKRF